MRRRVYWDSTDEDTGDEGSLMLGDEVEMDVVGAFILLLVAGNHHH